MRRLLAGALVATALVTAVPAAQAQEIFEPGGQCNGVVDVGCRAHVCQPDELDCGLIPPCVLWVAAVCVL